MVSLRLHRPGRPRSTAALAGVAALGALALGGVTGTHVAQAATVTVTNCNDSGLGSLRAAVATPGATIVTFAVSCPSSSPILLTTGPIDISTSLSINAPSSRTVVVDGNFNGGVFVVDAGATAGLTNLTVRNGTNGIGGGILNQGTLTVTNVTFSGNDAVAGGAIASGGTLTVVSSTFSHNAAGIGGGGGAIFSTGTLTVKSSIFTGNTAGGGNGGAIDNEPQRGNFDGPMSITGSVFTGNTAMCGGAVYNGSFTKATISGTRFTGNGASSSGAGIYNNTNGTLTLQGVSVQTNTAPFPEFGGGIYNDGSLAMTSTAITGNTAGQGGGIFNDVNGTLSLNTSSVTHNTATSSFGGGIFDDFPSKVTISSTSTVRNNTPNNCNQPVGTCA